MADNTAFKEIQEKLNCGSTGEADSNILDKSERLQAGKRFDIKV